MDGGLFLNMHGEYRGLWSTRASSSIRPRASVSASRRGGFHRRTGQKVSRRADITELPLPDVQCSALARGAFYETGSLSLPRAVRDPSSSRSPCCSEGHRSIHGFLDSRELDHSPALTTRTVCRSGNVPSAHCHAALCARRLITGHFRCLFLRYRYPGEI